MHKLLLADAPFFLSQMSGFFISTSRKPSVTTRRITRWLSALLAGGTENRGKRSVAQVAQRAADRGYSNVIIVHEDHGNPSQLCFMADGQMQAVANISAGEVPPVADSGPSPFRQLSRCRRVVEAQGAAGTVIGKLFQAGFSGEPEAGRELAVKVTDKGISFALDGKPVGPKLALRSYKLFEANAEGN